MEASLSHSSQQDRDNTEVRLTMAFNILPTIVYKLATRRVSADRDTSGTLTRKMANSMLMISLTRTSRDAQHPIQPSGTIARPQQAYWPQHIHDPSGGLGSLESQNSNRTSSRLQRQIMCSESMLTPADAHRPSRNLWKPTFRMFSIFSNKRARINDNRDDRIVKRQCKNPYEHHRSLGAKAPAHFNVNFQ